MTTSFEEQNQGELLWDSAAAARAGAAAASGRARALLRESHRLRWPTEISWPRMFVVRGEIEGKTVRAVWSRGTLVCSSALRRRGELLVAMGEEFGLEPGGPVLAAGFDDPAAAMLTLMRACDQVSVVQFSPVVGPGPADVPATPAVTSRASPTFRLLRSPGAVSALGDVDRSSAKRFELEATAALAELEWPVLDLGGVTFVDPDGALVMAGVLGATRAAVRNVSPAVRRVWGLLGLDAGLLA